MKVIRDVDYPWWKNTINIPHTITNIEETEINKPLRIDMVSVDGKKDEDGDVKYSMVDSKIVAKKDWKEVEPIEANELQAVK